MKNTMGQWVKLCLSYILKMLSAVVLSTVLLYSIALLYIRACSVEALYALMDVPKLLQGAVQYIPRFGTFLELTFSVIGLKDVVPELVELGFMQKLVGNLVILVCFSLQMYLHTRCGHLIDKILAVGDGDIGSIMANIVGVFVFILSSLLVAAATEDMFFYAAQRHAAVVTAIILLVLLCVLVLAIAKLSGKLKLLGVLGELLWTVGSLALIYTVSISGLRMMYADTGKIGYAIVFIIALLALVLVWSFKFAHSFQK